MLIFARTCVGLCVCVCTCIFGGCVCMCHAYMCMCMYRLEVSLGFPLNVYHYGKSLSLNLELSDPETLVIKQAPQSHLSLPLSARILGVCYCVQLFTCQDPDSSPDACTAGSLRPESPPSPNPSHVNLSPLRAGKTGACRLRRNLPTTYTPQLISYKAAIAECFCP